MENAIEKFIMMGRVTPMDGVKYMARVLEWAFEEMTIITIIALLLLSIASIVSLIKLYNKYHKLSAYASTHFQLQIMHDNVRRMSNEARLAIGHLENHHVPDSSEGRELAFNTPSSIPRRTRRQSPNPSTKRQSPKPGARRTAEELEANLQSMLE